MPASESSYTEVLVATLAICFSFQQVLVPNPMYFLFVHCFAMFVKGIVFVLALSLIFTSSKAVLPSYIPAVRGNVLSRDEIVEEYFKIGLSVPEITSFLCSVHRIFISLRQVKRILRRLGCRRRSQSGLNEIVEVVEEELRGSGSLLGYRAMHKRLTTIYGLLTAREVVRNVLKIVDPEGVEHRARHRLRRRVYRSKGPNYLWHIDGYDKLKPFGFCVHGAIDGFSRKILWLEVASSNNDPQIIAQYYLDYVRQLGGTARIIRADRGTENVNVAAIQRFFRSSSNDDFSGDKSFMYGKSTSNQRIEAWWGRLRQGCADWWIEFFKDMRDSGSYTDDNVIQRECLKFCFMDLIQRELHQVALEWNVHRIRLSSNLESPCGKPDINYFIPESVGAQDYNTSVDTIDIAIAEDMCAKRPQVKGCCPNFKELVETIMEDERLDVPTTADEACQLYNTLLDLIDDLF